MKKNSEAQMWQTNRECIPTCDFYY